MLENTCRLIKNSIKKGKTNKHEDYTKLIQRK